MLGRQIQLNAEDDACSPTEAITAGNKLVDQKPSVIFGFHCSSATLAAMQLIERAQIPMINSISTNPGIAAGSGVGGNKWVFTLTPTDATFATALVRFFKLQKVKSVAIVAENTDYGRGGAEAMRVRSKAFGIDVTSTNYYTQGTSDFSSLLAGIKSQRPDRVVYWGLGADDANFARQFAQNFQGTGTLLSGRPQLAGPDLPIVQSGALERATTVAQYDSHINTPANKKFVADYTKAYGAAPIIQSFEGYQEVMLAAAAIKQAKSASPAAIRNALAKIKFQSMMAPAKQATLHFDKYRRRTTARRSRWPAAARSSSRRCSRPDRSCGRRRHVPPPPAFSPLHTMLLAFTHVDSTLLVDLLVSGLVSGATYALAAAGLALIYGVMEVINMAHGELYMAGAFVGYLGVTQLHLPYVAVLLLATVALGAFGLILHDGLLARLGTAASSNAGSC